jgi:hypothetical protein
MASCFGAHALSVEGVVGMEKGEGVECKKKSMSLTTARYGD